MLDELLPMVVNDGAGTSYCPARSDVGRDGFAMELLIGLLEWNAVVGSFGTVTVICWSNRIWRRSSVTAFGSLLDLVEGGKGAVVGSRSRWTLVRRCGMGSGRQITRWRVLGLPSGSSYRQEDVGAAIIRRCCSSENTKEMTDAVLSVGAVAGK
ncbi:hypothetical protein ACLOJK_028746 [Asimina triloba]